MQRAIARNVSRKSILEFEVTVPGVKRNTLMDLTQRTVYRPHSSLIPSIAPRPQRLTGTTHEVYSKDIMATLVSAGAVSSGVGGAKNVVEFTVVAKNSFDEVSRIICRAKA
jgi:hypothetical protein